MTDVSEAARAVVFLADFAAADAQSKINAIGAAWQITSLTPTGATPPQTVVALVDVPQRFAGEQVALTLSLCDSSEDVVKAPQPDGTTQAVRVAQLAVVNKPTVPGAVVPQELWTRLQVVLTIPTGLPLQAGQIYHWKLEIDGTFKEEWVADFYIVAPPAQLVVG